MNDVFNSLLAKLQGSRNYSGICPDTLARVLNDSLARYKKPREAEKAAREKLHGITGAFMSPEEYHRAVSAMERYPADGDAALAEALSQHSSSRERLPLADMDALYARLFSITGRPRNILDLACGLNPLFLGARGLNTTGLDIQSNAISLINRSADYPGFPVRGICADLLSEGSLPPGHFSMALVFKLLPILEAQKTGAAASLLKRLDADHIIVTYPTRTLTGRNIGMEANYTRWMEQHLPDCCTSIERFTHGSELVYILKQK